MCIQVFEFSKTHNAIKPADQTESDLSRKKKTKFNMRFVEVYLNYQHNIIFHTWLLVMCDVKYFVHYLS